MSEIFCVTCNDYFSDLGAHPCSIVSRVPEGLPRVRASLYGRWIQEKHVLPFEVWTSQLGICECGHGFVAHEDDHDSVAYEEDLWTERRTSECSCCGCVRYVPMKIPPEAALFIKPGKYQPPLRGRISPEEAGLEKILIQLKMEAHRLKDERQRLDRMRSDLERERCQVEEEKKKVAQAISFLQEQERLKDELRSKKKRLSLIEIEDDF